MNDERVSSKDRSPNYPAIGLPAAIEASRKLWEKERRTSVPPEVAVRAIGYNSLSGAARTALASLRQYGLVEAGGGMVTVSPLAVDILVHEPQTDEWCEAIRTAAKAPQIFAELVDTHADASDAAISAYLISKRRFSPDGAKKLIRALRETAALANRAGAGYNKARNADDPFSDTDMIAPPIGSSPQISLNQQVTVMQFPLGGGLRAEIRFIGGQITPAHVQRLEEYLKVTSSALGEPA